MKEWERLWEECTHACVDQRSFYRAREHLLAQLVCMGRHTITSLLTTNARQFQDWSAAYRLYSKERIDLDRVFEQITDQVDDLRDSQKPLVVAMDDTILRKQGRCIPGTSYRRDPLGPPFQVNLVWAQRVLQLAAAIPGPEGDARMIPIDFKNAPTPRKPRAKAPEQEVAFYKEKLKQSNLNKLGIQRLKHLQEHRRAGQKKAPPIHLLVDGSFTNSKLIKNLPEATTLIGRIRKDAKLYDLPEPRKGPGRARVYGEVAPTPEELRVDAKAPWQEVEAYAVGKKRRFRVKTRAPVRWRKAGRAYDLRVIVIAPVSYHLKKGGKYLYRKPVYLICTDPTLSLETIVQEYIWRWDIEVNIRDEKTLLRVGEAQVRNEHSVEKVPASAVAAYALLHVAAIKAYGSAAQAGQLTLPAWRDKESKKRASTLDLINELRRELWSWAIRESNFSDFVSTSASTTKSEKFKIRDPSLADAVFYATG